ncbi:sphingosine kinase [Virgisporangium aliadipatigenens]|uniref:Sphingosine kinase n=1 Tax=Virgisporangium aliadipatigenens TaxID=741659 RepID=A0A8J3YMD5_9ACTN|nr:diacylglycerol kinase family protein [Virgisporangium aliadipatigenens]GIJ46530.1 sphingosine kinase [Virgisporangium aliadipatigenens]
MNWNGPRSAVVINPAKVVDLDDRRKRICDALAEAGWPEPMWFETTREDPGGGQARQAIEAGAEVVFACGGDGTVMACVGALAGTEVALAVLPAGTGNLLAANLGLPDDPAAGVAVAVDGGRRRIDVGMLEKRAFAVMAGMGFDAQLVRDAPEQLKAWLGWPAYVVSAAKHLRGRPMRVLVRLDDKRPIRRRVRTVLVANVGRLQGGIPLFADAEPDDGMLDIGLLTPRHLRDWIALGWAVLRKHEKVPRMEVHRARRVSIVSNRPQPRQLDGDVIEPGRRLTVAVRPRSLWLCVPQPAQAEDIAEGADELTEEAQKLAE